MVNTISSHREQQNENPVLNYEKDAYIVGDSLSVGITHGVNVAKNSVEWGKQTHWMLAKMQQDINVLRQKKVMFLLSGTNDIFVNRSAAHIIANIDKIAEFARQNWLKVVVGTIPPFTENTKTVQNAMRKLGTNHAERSAVLRAVNDYIRSKYDYIDYHKMIEDPNNPNNIKPEFAWKNSDGIHMYNAYKMMQQAQRDKLKTLSVDSEKNINTAENFSKNSPEKSNSELQNSIDALEKSIAQFQATVKWVFENKKMTSEQEGKMNEIISKKQEMLAEMKKILTEVETRKNELQLKNKELSVYQNAEQEVLESQEISEKISDLQKRILEIDEEQSIFLKNFRLLHEWIKLNEKLSPDEIEALRQMRSTEFLQMPREKRLQAVTIGNILPEKIIDGTIKDIEINFSFNGRFNRQLYLNTTAGMILPNEVREVSVKGEKFSRKNLEWEFFNEKWKRLIIRDETRLTIEKVETSENMSRNFISKIDINQFKTPLEKELAIESERRGVDYEMAKAMFGAELSAISDENIRRATMEDFFVDIDRKKWFYFRKTSENPMSQDGKMTLPFIAFLSQWNNEFYSQVAKRMGYQEAEIDTHKSNVVTRDYSGSIDNEKIMSMGISDAEIQRIRSIKQFQPNTPDTILLFRIAAKMAWLPEDWANNKNLHYILGRESNGKVGILNYTIKNMSLDRFYELANGSKTKNPIGAKSTASGLGQLLLSNVDKYYPNGRKGIGDPVSEAVGFMKYIEDRYGNPDVAASVYGKTGNYTHPTKGRQYKSFREWY